MCLDPASLIGTMMSVAGTAVNAGMQQSYTDEVNNQNNKAYEISRQARVAEQTRQKAYQDQSMGAWQKALGQVDQKAQGTTTDAAANRFMQEYDQNQGVQPLTDGLLPAQAGASDEVAKNIATQMATSAADTRKRVAALSKLAGYGSADAANKLALSDSADFLTTINGLRRGSLGVSQQEQSINPATVSKPSSILGDVLSGLGGIGLYQGGANSTAKAA